MTGKARSQKKMLPKDLRSKIVWHGHKYLPGILCPPEEVRERVRSAHDRANAEVMAEKLRKLKLLAEYHGLNTAIPAWETALCYILATEFYTGFQVVTETIGRPREWDYERYLRLLCDVEKTKRNLRAKARGAIEISSAHAVEILVKNGTYRCSPGQSKAVLVKTLKNRLADAIDRKRNPFLAGVWKHPNAEEREAMLDQIVPRFCSPEKV